MVAHLHTLEGGGIAEETAAAQQLHLLVHLKPDGLLLLFGGTLQALSQSLIREAVLINAVNSITDIEEIPGHEHGGFRHERQERDLLHFRQPQLRHYLNLFTAVF